MSSEVENMFYVGDTPWHGLGERLIDPPTLEEAIVAAGLDWQVVLKDLQVTETGQEVAHRAVIRETDNSVLGVVGPRYNPLQNKEAFNFFSPFLAAGEASLHTAGSLREGKRVWVLAKINKDPMEIVPGDVVEKFVLLSNSHDGTLAVRVGFTPIRVVCNNTLSLAHTAGNSQLIRIRHSAKVKENLEDVREIMNIADQQFTANAEQFYKLLANVNINSKDLDKYIKLCLNIKPKVEVINGKTVEKFSTRGKTIVNDVVSLFESGRGNNMPGVKGTYWASYNAITEYLSYNRGTSQDKRMDSLWFGDAAKINQKSLELGVEMATAI